MIGQQGRAPLSCKPFGERLFYRLVQQAVAVEPVPYHRLIGRSGKPQPVAGT
jgi:hypothetical protein